MTAADKIRENRARRSAERQGVRLVKSRRRDPRAVDFGTYGLVDPNHNTLVLGDSQSGYGMTIEDIEEWLTSPSI